MLLSLGGECMEYIDTMLMELGVDVKGVLLRLGQNENLYLSLCQKFIKDTTYQLFMDSLLKHEYKKAAFYVHTLKGISANLGFHRLEQYCLRLQEEISMQQVGQKHISLLTNEYQKIILVLMEKTT